VDQFTRHLRLLVDLFEHKVGVSPFRGHLHALGDHLRLPCDEAPVRHPPQFHPVGPQDGDLAVLHPEDAAGERQDGGQVGGDAGEPLGETSHQSRSFLDGVQLVLSHSSDDEGIVPFQVLVGAADRVHHAVSPVHVSLHRVDAGLAVVGGADRHPLGDKLLAQLHVVDHVAVVGAHQVTVRVQVGLGVGLGGSAERGPAQLHDAPAAGHLGEP